MLFGDVEGVNTVAQSQAGKGQDCRGWPETVLHQYIWFLHSLLMESLPRKGRTPLGFRMAHTSPELLCSGVHISAPMHRKWRFSFSYEEDSKGGGLGRAMLWLIGAVSNRGNGTMNA